MILHCDDGIRHVEAILEEPTSVLFLFTIVDVFRMYFLCKLSISASFH